jgi:hypothetical protein
MAKIGPIMTIPGGSYCYFTLDLGQRLVVAHQLGDRAGGSGEPCFTVERLTLMGFSSESVLRIDLGAPEGHCSCSRAWMPSSW